MADRLDKWCEACRSHVARKGFFDGLCKRHALEKLQRCGMSEACAKAVLGILRRASRRQKDEFWDSLCADTEANL